MANVGDLITMGQGGYSGYAPGQNVWNMSGKQGTVIGTRNQGGQTYYNIDFSKAPGGAGQGTGWVSGNYINMPTASPAPAATPAPASPAPAPAATPAPAQTYATNVDSTLAAQQAARDKAYQGYTDQLNGAINSYMGAVDPAIQAADAKYNVTGLSNLANNLGTRVSQLQTNSNGEGAGGYASSDQVDAAVNSRFMPAYNQAVTNLNSGSQLAQNMVTQKLAPYTTQISTLNDQVAREMTGFTQGQQNELTALLNKASLSESEAQRAQDLALEEQKYQNAVQVANISNRYYPDYVNGGVIDAQTGKPIGGGSPINLGSSAVYSGPSISTGASTPTTATPPAAVLAAPTNTSTTPSNISSSIDSYLKGLPGINIGQYSLNPSTGNGLSLGGY